MTEKSSCSCLRGSMNSCMGVKNMSSERATVSIMTQGFHIPAGAWARREQKSWQSCTPIRKHPILYKRQKEQTIPPTRLETPRIKRVLHERAPSRCCVRMKSLFLHFKAVVVTERSFRHIVKLIQLNRGSFSRSFLNPLLFSQVFLGCAPENEQVNLPEMEQRNG